jgi:hypothetical protein
MNIVNYGDSKNLTGELTKGKIIVQSFTAAGPKLNIVGIDFGTYKRLNKGVLALKVMDKDSVTLFNDKIDTRYLKNNVFNDINVNLKLKVGEKYYLLLYGVEGTNGYTVSAKYGKPIEGEKFVLNGTEIVGALHCCFKYEKIIKQVKPNLKEIVPEKNKEALISIIIPTYNTAKYLSATLKSIAEQTYNNVEVIVVDDKSSVLEKSEIKSICKNADIPVKTVMKRVHVGAAIARNIGAEKATGQYLFFCDSDVVLDKDCLCTMIQTLHDNPDCAWAYCNYKIGDKTMKYQEFDEKIFRRKKLSSTMSLMYTNKFPKFNPDLERLQDWDLFLQMVDNGEKGKWINKVLFTTEDRDGITKNSIPWNDAVAVLRKLHPNM